MPSMPVLLLVMAGAAFACRIAGFVAMRYLPPSARLEAALRATPLAVMSAITALALQAGGLVESLALGSAVVLTLLIRNDIFAAILAIGVAAGLRAMGF